MLPSMRRALAAITSSKRPVIAIKTMAGGRIPPDKALHFALEEVHVSACCIGAASEEEFDADIDEAKHILSMREH